jgi:hypothetical protein
MCPICIDEIRDGVATDEALDHRYVDLPRDVLLASADLTDQSIR